MTNDTEKQLRERAYEIWQDEGQPEGRADRHWEQARRELQEAQLENTVPGARGAGSPLKKSRTAGKETSASPERASATSSKGPASASAGGDSTAPKPRSRKTEASDGKRAPARRARKV